MPVTDLNLATLWGESLAHIRAETAQGHVRRHARIRPGDRPYAVAHLPTVCAALRRPPQDPVVRLSGSIRLLSLRSEIVKKSPIRDKTQKRHS
jgi:hypothetical protein